MIVLVCTYELYWRRGHVFPPVEPHGENVALLYSVLGVCVNCKLKRTWGQIRTCRYRSYSAAELGNSEARRLGGSDVNQHVYAARQ